MIESVGGGMSNTQMLELRQKMMEQMKNRLKKADTDGTEGLSKEELTAMSDKLKSEGKENTGFIDKIQESFDKIDTDGNGQLTESEMKAAKDELRPDHPPGGGMGKGGKGGGGGQNSSSSETSEIVYENGQTYEVTKDASGMEISRAELSSSVDLKL